MGSIPIRFRQRAVPQRPRNGSTMPIKRRKKFSVPKEVRRRSRAALGSPPATRVVENRRRKPPKHKKKLTELELTGSSE